MIDILIVEDNKELAQLLSDFLRNEDYVVSIACDGEKAFSAFERYGARLVILDIMLPGIDGFSICRKIREIDNVPIIIVSAKGEKEDKLKGLELGADDYIEKPYDIDILLAKIAGIFKRHYGTDELRDGQLVLDRIKKSAVFNGEPLVMTAKEFELLLLLVENKGKVLTKEYLFRTVWESDCYSELQTLTVHINRLRAKIEADPKNPQKIITVWGTGYKYQ